MRVAPDRTDRSSVRQQGLCLRHSRGSC